MLQWIVTNLGTICICAGLAAIVALILRSLIRKKKQGACSHGCSDCPGSCNCHQSKGQLHPS